ncbi:penicillin acylase family protein [Pyxidicoccus sp. MSG2]|uniref:penicillin acylase family protein n=1 Tax=Pyxidicoccus sp. MSG2 TaxID=2996790 RepID=UPI00226FE54A|nr:penicillin acylase family protein [Pyxidicoccus sp. MSG2]MCY1023111.1 penicillin acylase family protein [Pyxidicoccus sp. MSG2]
MNPIPASKRGARLAPLALLLLATACDTGSPEAAAHAPSLPAVKLAATGGLSATVRRTSHGIPHVLAQDYAGLGYGYGYAFAQDNLCELAQVVVTVSAQRSRYFGPDATYPATLVGDIPNLKSDFFYQSINDAGTVEALVAQAPPRGPSVEMRELVRGYVAGYNRYLRETGVDALPDPRCRGAAWVRPLTELDLFRRYYQLSLLASSGAFLTSIVDAQPPGPLPDGALPVPLTLPDVLPAGAIPKATDLGMGSNAIGLGREGTRNGNGMVLGNPHFPWEGSERFYQVHLTLPGQLDVSGASLLGVPAVLIGHNAHVAWSHTVSTGFRFTPYELKLVPGSPTTYLYNGQLQQMTPRPTTVLARKADGTLEPRTHTFYWTRFGPMFDYPAGYMTWNALTGYAFRDVNATNFRVLDQFLAMNRAGSVDALRQAQDYWQGIPWVNTVAADDQGRAFYADSAVVPHVTDEMVARCVLSPVALLVYQSAGLPVLDGTRADCEWGSDADAVEPGMFGPGRMPHLVRQDYVTNSNDSYWLSNPAQPLTGYDRIIGAENTARSLRTRVGLKMVQGRLAGTDGLEGQRFTLDQLQTVAFNNWNFSGELLRDSAVAMCRRNPFILAKDGRLVDVRAACPVLEKWNLRGDLDSAGGLLWRQFISRIVPVTGGPYLVPFLPTDPVNTPRGLNTLHPQVVQALGGAVQVMQARGLPLDVTLGAVQRVHRNEARIPYHGCGDPEGCFNAMGGRLLPDYTYVPFLGTSFVMAVSFTDTGPVGRSVLAYSQSSSPASPYFADQTWLFSRKQWVDMRFTEADIASDPELSVTLLQE